jgi:hypothetical protein
VDAAGNAYMSIEELKRQEAQRRAGAGQLPGSALMRPAIASITLVGVAVAC